jgi:hypothetical protein
MYNTKENRKTRKSTNNSLKTQTISKKDKNNIYRRITNKRVARCQTICKEDERGRIGSCVITNTTIGLKDCINPDGKTRYHYIRPNEIAVDTLQWAFNTGKAEIIEIKDGKNGTSMGNSSYLVLNDFPSLQIETVETEKDDEYKDSRRFEGFYQAYEDNTTLDILNYSKQLELYLADSIYYNAVKYTSRMIEKGNNGGKDRDRGKDRDTIYKDGTTTQDINYVKIIAAGLEKAYTFSRILTGTGGTGIKAELTNPDALRGDLAGMEKYIILEPMKPEDGDEYIICGYPDLSKMRTYLSLRNDPIIGKALNDIYAMQRTGFARMFAEMHNSILDTSLDAGSGDATRINLDQLDKEIHKFMKSINITYFESWIMTNGQLDSSNEDSWVNSADFKKKIQLLRDNGLGAQADYIESEIERTCLTSEEREKQIANIPIVYREFARYVNELLLEYLNKPMTRIRYHFLIYRRTSEGTLVPAIFNIKQLEPGHKPLLERVHDLIQTRIPKIFSILEDSRHGLDRYKLFHSYVKYGDFFYITTEYLHTMSNFTHYAYLYENSMELEEIIYSLSRAASVPNFWQSLRIDYQLKKFRIAKSEVPGIPGIPEVPGILAGGARYSARSVGRSSRKPRTNKNNRKTTPLKGTIMMIYQKSYQEYSIIYKDESHGVFKVLELKSNLAACSRDILQQVARLQGMDDLSSIKFNGRLFKVVSIRTFDAKMMKELKNHNPLVVKVMQKPNTDSQYISLKEMIKTELLENKFLEDTQIINVCHYHPIIYFNFMMNINYIKALLKYQSKPLIKDLLEFQNTTEEKDKSVIEYGKYYPVKYIINPENCEYDIIVSSRTSVKTVLWILPHILAASDTQQPNAMYLRNFTYLNNLHIPLLNVIKHLFLKDGFICFIHIQATHIYGLLHLHIAKFNEYRREYPVEEQGSRITREINIDDIIHKLSIDNRYYIDFTVPNLNVII